MNGMNALLGCCSASAHALRPRRQLAAVAHAASSYCAKDVPLDESRLVSAVFHGEHVHECCCYAKLAPSSGSVAARRLAPPLAFHQHKEVSISSSRTTSEASRECPYLTRCDYTPACGHPGPYAISNVTCASDHMYAMLLSSSHVSSRPCVVNPVLRSHCIAGVECGASYQLCRARDRGVSTGRHKSGPSVHTTVLPW